MGRLCKCPSPTTPLLPCGQSRHAALQSLEATVEPWFAPAYALILLREQGTHVCSYPDEGKSKYSDATEKDGREQMEMPVTLVIVFGQGLL